MMRGWDDAKGLPVSCVGLGESEESEEEEEEEEEGGSSLARRIRSRQTYGSLSEAEGYIYSTLCIFCIM